MEKHCYVRVRTTPGVSAVKCWVPLDTEQQCFLNVSNVLMNHLGSCSNAGFDSVDLERGLTVCISNEPPQFTL